MPKKTRYNLTNIVEGNVTVEQAILAYIKNGVYPWVAAEAAGIPSQIFDLWLSWRKRKGKWYAPYRSFADKVEQAKSIARAKAEMSVFTSKPREWLKEGPGKDQPDSPGWSQPPEPILTNQTQINVLANPEWAGLWSTILKALADFPEARLALTDAIKSIQQDQK